MLDVVAILPLTPEKLEELADLAEKIEERLGRELEYVAGGATASLMRIWDGNIPKKINLLESRRGNSFGNGHGSLLSL